MKKFEINFYNVWGAGIFELLTIDFYKAKTATFLDVTICNFELSFSFRSAQQIKEQKKWDRQMEKRVEEWTKAITPKKKVAAKKRKTTK